jgi:uncharacterized phage infection (PIP) family protein YhgE
MENNNINPQEQYSSQTPNQDFAEDLANMDTGFFNQVVGDTQISELLIDPVDMIVADAMQQDSQKLVTKTPEQATIIQNTTEIQIQDRSFGDKVISKEYSQSDNPNRKLYYGSAVVTGLLTSLIVATNYSGITKNLENIIKNNPVSEYIQNYQNDNRQKEIDALSPTRDDLKSKIDAIQAEINKLAATRNDLKRDNKSTVTTQDQINKLVAKRLASSQKLSQIQSQINKIDKQIIKPKSR